MHESAQNVVCPPCLSHMDESFHIEHSTGRRTPITCFTLQVIFRKRATNYRVLLRKVTNEDKASHDSTPPCILKAATGEEMEEEQEGIEMLLESGGLGKGIRFLRFTDIVPKKLGPNCFKTRL